MPRTTRMQTKTWRYERNPSTGALERREVVTGYLLVTPREEAKSPYWTRFYDALDADARRRKLEAAPEPANWIPAEPVENDGVIEFRPKIAEIMRRLGNRRTL